jgi:hypothetical protein
MAALEVKPGRRDDPFQQVQRGSRRPDARSRQVRRRRDEPHHLALEARRLAVTGEPGPGHAHPGRVGKRLGGGGPQRRARRCAGERALQEVPPAEDAIARYGLTPPRFPLFLLHFDHGVRLSRS